MSWGRPGGYPGVAPRASPGCPGDPEFGSPGHPGDALGTVHSPSDLAGRSGALFYPLRGLPQGSPRDPPRAPCQGALGGCPGGPEPGPQGARSGHPGGPVPGTPGRPSVLKVTQLPRTRFPIEWCKYNFDPQTDPRSTPPTPPGRLPRSGHPGVPPQGARQALNPTPPGRGPRGVPLQGTPQDPLPAWCPDTSGHRCCAPMGDLYRLRPEVTFLRSHASLKFG